MGPAWSQQQCPSGIFLKSLPVNRVNDFTVIQQMVLTYSLILFKFIFILFGQNPKFIILRFVMGEKWHDPAAATIIDHWLIQFQSRWSQFISISTRKYKNRYTVYLPENTRIDIHESSEVMNASSEVDNATATAGTGEPAGLTQEEISNQLLFVIEGVVLGSVACLGIAGAVPLL